MNSFLSKTAQYTEQNLGGSVEFMMTLTLSMVSAAFVASMYALYIMLTASRDIRQKVEDLEVELHRATRDHSKLYDKVWMLERKSDGHKKSNRINITDDAYYAVDPGERVDGHS